MSLSSRLGMAWEWKPKFDPEANDVTGLAFMLLWLPRWSRGCLSTRHVNPFRARAGAGRAGGCAAQQGVSSRIQRPPSPPLYFLGAITLSVCSQCITPRTAVHTRQQPVLTTRLQDAHADAGGSAPSGRLVQEVPHCVHWRDEAIRMARPPQEDVARSLRTQQQEIRHLHRLP